MVSKSSMSTRGNFFVRCFFLKLCFAWSFHSIVFWFLSFLIFLRSSYHFRLFFCPSQHLINLECFFSELIRLFFASGSSDIFQLISTFFSKTFQVWIKWRLQIWWTVVSVALEQWLFVRLWRKSVKLIQRFDIPGIRISKKKMMIPIAFEIKIWKNCSTFLAIQRTWQKFSVIIKSTPDPSTIFQILRYRT